VKYRFLGDLKKVLRVRLEVNLKKISEDHRLIESINNKN